MHKVPFGVLRRGFAVAAVAASVTLGLVACNDSTSIDPQRDRIPPTLSLTPLTGRPDTVIAFSTEAKDNLGLKTIHVQAIGAVGFVYDTVFTSAVTDIQLPFTLFANRTVPPGTPVTITATAYDGAGNSSGVDTLRMATGNLPPPDVRVLSPFSGSSAVVGKSILVTVMGKAATKVLSLGLNSTGPVVRNDSVLFASPMLDSTTMQDTIAIPANAAPGTLTITPFLRDSLGQRTTGPSITINVQTAAQINSVPVVNQYCLGNSGFDNQCGHGKRGHGEEARGRALATGIHLWPSPGTGRDRSVVGGSAGQLPDAAHTSALSCSAAAAGSSAPAMLR